MSFATRSNNPGFLVRIFTLMPGHLLSLELQASPRSRRLSLILMFPGEIKECQTRPAVELLCLRCAFHQRRQNLCQDQELVRSKFLSVVGVGGSEEVSRFRPESGWSGEAFPTDLKSPECLVTHLR